MKKAILDKDFPKFAELTMKDSNSFHAVCLDSYPQSSISTIRPKDYKMVETINQQEVVAAYTLTPVRMRSFTTTRPTRTRSCPCSTNISVTSQVGKPTTLLKLLLLVFRVSFKRLLARGLKKLVNH